MKNKSNFVVLSTQRSGSTWFLDLFSNCENTEGHGELFYAHRRKNPAKSGFNEFDRFCEIGYSGVNGYRPFRVMKYLNDLYSRPAQHIGFKLQYSDLKKYPEIIVGLLFNRTAAVHLVRVNSLDIVISAKLAVATGKSHITEKSEQQNVKVRISPDECLMLVTALERKKVLMRRVCQLLFRKYIEVSYEELTADITKFKMITQFLGIDEVNDLLTSTLVKRQTQDRSEVIENYSEIKEMLDKNSLSHFLDD